MFCDVRFFVFSSIISTIVRRYVEVFCVFFSCFVIVCLLFSLFVFNVSNWSDQGKNSEENKSKTSKQKKQDARDVFEEHFYCVPIISIFAQE